MELEELHEKIKSPKRFYLLLQANVGGWHLCLEKIVDAVSKQDAWHQVQHRLETANETFFDLSEINWRVRRVHAVGPPKKSRRAR